MRSPSRTRSPRHLILPPTRDGVTRKKESKRRRSEGGREVSTVPVRIWKDGDVEVGSEKSKLV